MTLRNEKNKNILKKKLYLDEADDEDDWTPAKAAGVCVMLLAQCVGDTILDCVMPFFAHFSSQDWKYKVKGAR